MSTATLTIDRGVLQAWYERTYPRVLAYACSRLGRDEQRALDVVQDVYCRVLERAEHYHLDPETDDQLPLLIGLAKYRCFRAWKDRSQPSMDDRVGQDRDADRHAFLADRGAGRPDRIAEANELGAWLEGQLDGLTALQLEALAAWLQCLRRDYFQELLAEGKLCSLDLRGFARLRARDWGPWYARPAVDGVTHDLGAFETKDEAMAAIRAWARPRSPDEYDPTPLF